MKSKSIGSKLAARRSLLVAGFSLVEMVIYIGLLALMLLSLLAAVNLMSRSWKVAQGHTALAAAGSIAMERIMHDVRGATSVDSAGSSFVASSSILKLSSIDSSGNATTTTFSVTRGMLYANLGAAASTSLLMSGVGVQAFTAYHITTTNSESVRIVLQLVAATTTATTTATFYDTAVLRGSY